MILGTVLIKGLQWLLETVPDYLSGGFATTRSTETGTCPRDAAGFTAATMSP